MVVLFCWGGVGNVLDVVDRFLVFSFLSVVMMKRSLIHKKNVF